eukprot:3074200-Rhodomonas_salina.1
MASAPRWHKENQLSKFDPAEVIATAEEWQTWTIQTFDKFNAMEYPFFIPAAEALVFEDEQFHELVAHPVPDVFTDPIFPAK